MPLVLEPFRKTGCRRRYLEHQLHFRKYNREIFDQGRIEDQFYKREMTNHQTKISEEEIERPGEIIIPVIEEYAVIDKEIVETGKVKISKRIKEQEQFIDVPLMHEEVSVERVPVNQFIETRPEIRYEGDIMIIPVVEQRVVLQKQLFLTEELHVRRQVIETHHTEEMTLLKEEVDITRSAIGENFEGKR